MQKTEDALLTVLCIFISGRRQTKLSFIFASNRTWEWRFAFVWVFIALKTSVSIWAFSEWVCKPLLHWSASLLLKLNWEIFSGIVCGWCFKDILSVGSTSGRVVRFWNPFLIGLSLIFSQDISLSKSYSGLSKRCRDKKTRKCDADRSILQISCIASDEQFEM